MSITNPHLQRIETWAAAYHVGDLDAEGLQQNLAAIAMAIEGDVPRKAREAVDAAEEKIELIRFTFDSPEREAEISRVLRELMAAIDAASLG